jgi:hypothetical protein
MTTEQIKKIKEAIKQACPELKTHELKPVFGVLDELATDEGKIEFEEFWQRYPKKIGRFKCTQIWRMMGAKNQQLAITHLRPYINAVQPYIHDPENYLNKRLYMDYEYEARAREKTKSELYKQ